MVGTVKVFLTMTTTREKENKVFFHLLVVFLLVPANRQQPFRGWIWPPVEFHTAGEGVGGVCACTVLYEQYG